MQELITSRAVMLLWVAYCRFVFCCPLCVGLSSHPAEIAFGVLKTDGTLWLNIFKNYGKVEELEEFERLYREKIAAIERDTP
jgi:hypothetical protein